MKGRDGDFPQSSEDDLGITIPIIAASSKFGDTARSRISLKYKMFLIERYKRRVIS